MLHQLRCGDERRVAHLRSDGILVVVEGHLPADPGEIGEDHGRGRIEIEDAGQGGLLGAGDPLPVARMGVEEPRLCREGVLLHGGPRLLRQRLGLRRDQLG